ncbi:MAG: OmpA family protein [Bacteroidia bacterium]
MTRTIFFILSYFLFVALAEKLKAQNLIPNPSFEEATQKVNSKNGNNPVEMKQSNKAKPDYYFQGTKGRISTEFSTNIRGKYNEYHGGKVMVGIMGCGSLNADSNQYLQVKLKQKLIKDQRYCLSFFVRPPSSWLSTTNEIDYNLSSNKLDLRDTENRSLMLSNYKKIRTVNWYFLPNTWTKIFSCYNAIGDEEFLTIGFMNPDYKIFPISNSKPLNRKIYLFIDEISLVPIVGSATCDCIETNTPETNDFGFAINKPLALKNINFESGKAKLLPTSNEELNKLVLYLKNNLLYKIEIAGHTDNTGNEAENKMLSQERAKAVANYLIVAGVNEKRISYKGNGSLQPLKPNDTEENKLLNRRVEIKLFE